ncbi:MAG: hypothetical protein NVSMB14_02410 [Isosphaeraceae bacterium]
MRQRRVRWHERIKAVEREFLAARFAVERLSAAVVRDPRVLGSGPTPRDLESAVRNLDGTYLIRLFAEFEIGIRSLWKSIRPRTRPPVEVLLARIADRFGISARILEAAQRVRLY